MRTVNQLVVHCSATPPSMDIGRDEIREWHLARGFSREGYHFIIRRNGDLEMGRPLDMIGAHAKGHNTHSVGICLVGGTTEASGRPINNFTPEQYTTLIVLIDGLVSHFNLDYTDVVGHRDLLGVTKACPCFDVQGWLLLWEGESLR